MALSPFHLAIPVYDLALARRFYGEVLGLGEGRSSAQWVDFDFFGHQLVIHLHPRTASQTAAHTTAVDGHDVPVPHFGVVLDWGTGNVWRSACASTARSLSSSPTCASRDRWASRRRSSSSTLAAMPWSSSRSRISASCSLPDRRSGVEIAFMPHGNLLHST